ncbi:MAG: hypothetical protein HOI74_04100 [Gammaproteobacteria bacterium]|nr:hypothetical protein [Gammaproteobacteria bacterium]
MSYALEQTVIPLLLTFLDHINRAMPNGNEKPLSTDEVYAITANVFNLNDIVPEDFILAAGSCTAITELL